MEQISTELDFLCTVHLKKRCDVLGKTLEDMYLLMQLSVSLYNRNPPETFEKRNFVVQYDQNSIRIQTPEFIPRFCSD